MEQAKNACGRDEGRWCPLHGRDGCKKWLRPDVWSAVQHLEAKHGVTHAPAKVQARVCFGLPAEPPTEAPPDAAKQHASEPYVPVKEKEEKAAPQSSGSVVQAAQDQDPGLALLAGFFTTVADRVLGKGQGK